MGIRARALLSRVEENEEAASTSALTIDEVIWAVKKYRNREQALDAGGAVIDLKGLDLIPLDEHVMRDALELMRTHGFDPRDAIHAASARRCGSDCIISMDSHFDRLDTPPRRTLEDVGLKTKLG